MRFGVTLPNAGRVNDPSVLAELASDAEDAGWDGAARSADVSQRKRS